MNENNSNLKEITTPAGTDLTVKDAIEQKQKGYEFVNVIKLKTGVKKYIFKKKQK